VYVCVHCVPVRTHASTHANERLRFVPVHVKLSSKHVSDSAITLERAEEGQQIRGADAKAGTLRPDGGRGV